MKGLVHLSIVFLWMFSSSFSIFVTATDDDYDADQEEKTSDILFFMFLGLGIGVAISQIISHYGEVIPYTVLVFLVGMLFSTAVNESGSLGTSVAEWVDINAELMLYIFLPPLVFGEAMNLNWYHLKGAFLQSVILAGPGVLIGAALMGVATKFILPYNWCWNLAMTFGSILAATDTVAVLALLKSVGAAPKMTMLIVGESLLNDGSAIVLFTIFFEALKGTKFTAVEILNFSLAAVFGSVLFGIACGLCTVRWLRTANRPLTETDVTMQIGITICCAYLTFFIAQNLCGISGVLACCSAGAMLAWLGPPIILNHESMHNVWGMAEWALNTMIFLLAGLIIGNRVLHKVSRLDWLYVFVLYLVLMIVRAATIFVLYPFLSGIGHGCHRNEAIFMSWTGLRGAVGMALALIVQKTGPGDLDDEISRLFFYDGGIATLSLLINGTTAKPLLFRLGLLTSDSAEKLLLTNQIKKKLRKKMDKVVSNMTKEFAFTENDLMEVRLSCTLLQEFNTEALFRDTERMSNLLVNAMHEDKSHHSQPSQPQHQQQPQQQQGRPSAFAVDNGESPSELRRRATSTSFNRRSRAQSMGLSANAMAFHQNTMKLQRMSRLLSTSHRDANHLMVPELVNYIRAIFLEIVRVKYWHFIEVGKLPRLSYSAQFLLYSIEVALDDVGNSEEQQKDKSSPSPSSSGSSASFASYSKDWNCVESQLSSPHHLIDFLSFLDKKLPISLTQHFITNSLAFLETRKEKREVYMLTSFIEAHEHAQSKIHKFLNPDEINEDEEDDDDDEGNSRHGRSENNRKGSKTDPNEEENSFQTLEEKLVLEESKRAVEEAKKVLRSMYPQEVIAAIRSKQAARMVLAQEAQLVKSMVDEGLLTPKYAEEFLEEISEDTHRIEKERNRLYKDQANRRAKEKRGMRFAEEVE